MAWDRLRVLVVDDDKNGYGAIKRLLTKIFGDIEIGWAESYEAGQRIILEARHEIYLVSYQLGTQGGLQLLQDAIAQGCTAPIILLTDADDHPVDQATLQAGAAAYLVKSQIDAPSLELAVRHALERFRTLDELRQALREKSLLASAIANTSTGVVITDPHKADNPIIFVNHAFEEITGYSANEVLGQNCRFLRGPGSDPVICQQIRDAIALRQSLTCTLLNYRKDGSPFWNEFTISPVFDEHGELLNFVGVQNDVTDRKRAEAALRESEERYALAVLGANDGIWDWNLKTNQIYLSPRWKAILGYLDSELESTTDEWFQHIHPDDFEWFQFHLSAHLEGITPHFEHEHRIRHQDGSYRWVLTRGLAVRNSNSQVTRLAGSQSDITARKQAEEQLLHDALHDSLTGLPNRTLMMDRLRHALQIAQRNPNYQFAVLFLDVDRFKVINDSLGHMAGDRLLVTIAQRLKACIRPSDTFSRLGGDEFVVLLEDIQSVNDATKVAKALQRAISKPFNLEGNDVFTTISIGIALSGGYQSPTDLLRDADTAMYQAKAKGKARYEIFTAGMHVNAVTQLQLETDLRHAIERNEFHLCYQPIIALRTGQIAGFEALLRWQHPDRGIISPAEFIPLAEETGLIIPLGNWVLQEACRQMRQWHLYLPSSTAMTISVNLSGKQFTAGLVEQIETILQTTHLPPYALKLEITESVLMENTEAAALMLSQLQGIGVKLSMDDFGTGYSSLNYLHRFPIDTLKIDRSFINKIDSDAEQLAIVRTIVTLAWNLGMEVVAEGIETVKQLSQMKAFQCEYGQGYFFSPPVDAETATQLITNQFAHYNPGHSLVMRWFKALPKSRRDGDTVGNRSPFLRKPTALFGARVAFVLNDRTL